jgi:hypothetical protein
MKRGPVPPKSFPMVSVTAPGFAMLQGHEAAAKQMGEAIGASDIQSAYRVLTEMRSRLYTYVSLLEQVAREHGAAIGEPHFHVRF